MPSEWQLSSPGDEYRHIALAVRTVIYMNRPSKGVVITIILIKECSKGVVITIININK